MVLGAQAPGRVGRRPFNSKGPNEGPSSFLDEPWLIRVARVELPTAAGVRTLEAVADRQEMRGGVFDGLRAVQLRRFSAAAVHAGPVPAGEPFVTRVVRLARSSSCGLT
jgi:hypothetical protein